MQIGAKLGPYEVIAKLGEGGMGEVYRARDTRLDRSVAIKVLPEALASDPAFRERFDREARSIAALNHPHICTLHDIGHHEGTDFLVMELVDGDTLAERLREGPLSIDETLTLAHQIAQALEAAHERGILHRDLKPANIKLTADGAVKVLDFGLAKLYAPAEAGSRTVVGPGFTAANSPTISMTQPGMIIGTAAYMSPEQARGKSVDRRTDVWAFGCVLYEMLTARPAFDGETVTDILGAIVHKEPDWNALPATMPPRLHELLRRCLEKDVKRRLRDIGDAGLDIEAARSSPALPSSTTLGSAAPVTVARWRTALPWAIAVTLAIALGGVATGWWRTASRHEPITRVNVEMSPKMPFSPLWGQAAVLSPDGSHLVYLAGLGQERRLFVRRLDQLEGAAFSGTQNAATPFFSPDGRWIGFFGDGALKKIALTGGAPVTLATPGEGRGATWGPNDVIVFAASTTSGLFHVSAAGGNPELLTTRDEQTERSHRWPQFLPGPNAVLFTVQLAGRRWDESNIEVVDLATRERKIVHRGGTFARYVSSGHLVFVREGTLFAAPFDLARLEVTGQPIPVLEGIMAQPGEGGSGIALYDVSSTGTMAYVTGPSTSDSGALVLVDRTGTPTRVVEERANYLSPRFSPDGRRIALYRPTTQATDIWVYEIQQRSFRRLTFSPAADAFPIWTPDGQRVTYASGGSAATLYWTLADGSGQPERLAQSNYPPRPGSWSPDGKLLVFTEQSPKTNGDIWTLARDGDRKPEVFLQTPANEVNPEFSPDGRWIAYQSDESGRFEIYVRRFPDSGGKWQISSDGGVQPLWSRSTPELVYRITGDRMMSVAVRKSAGRSFEYDEPRELFRDGFAVRGNTTMYDIAPDGQRFVMVQDGAGSALTATHLTMVFNWFDDLKARFAAPR